MVPKAGIYENKIVYILMKVIALLLFKILQHFLTFCIIMKACKVEMGYNCTLAMTVFFRRGHREGGCRGLLKIS